ncbi:RHS repeat-associated core domain-containing protein [Loktanella agnita]|uniref:RHS repeat-associated core domain-containing protein n=1 Tax=Loktanella agnita TaxID=287097 RepID=UPI0039881FAF
MAWRAKFGLWGNAEKIDIWRGEVANGEDVTCQIRFQGQWADEESGLYYNRFRYYDAEAGQYCSSDLLALAGGSRPQSYVTDPNNFIDPLGLASCNIRYDHILDGNINGMGNGSGGHYSRSSNTRVREQINGPDRNGVSTGKIQVRDPATGRWVDKNATTSFFPDHWSRRQTKQEIAGAFQNASPMPGNPSKWQGTSPSGVPMEGYYSSTGGADAAWPVYGG